MATNRETERDSLVALIQADMVGSGEPLQAVFGYQTLVFSKQKKLTAMVVTGGGTEADLRRAGNEGVSFFFNLHAFVLYETSGWTEQQSEDRLDLIEYRVRELLKVHTSSTKKYAFSGRTLVNSLVLSGEEYRREIIPVSVWLPNG